MIVIIINSGVKESAIDSVHLFKCRIARDNSTDNTTP